MIGEFQPKFDYHPKFTKDTNGVWQPVIDEATGRQAVDRVALPTFHQLFWPADKTVSSISAQSWFTLSKGWDNTINPVTGHYWFIGSNLDGNGAPLGPPKYLGDDSINMSQDWEWTASLPAGCKKISIQLDPHDHAIGWALEIKAL